MNKEIFGERLKLIRLEKRLSLEELGKIIGVSKTTLSKYERAMREPKITIINDLAEYFEVPVEWLIGYDENKSTNITSIYNELKPPRQQKVYNFAEQQLEEQNNKIVEFPVQKTRKEKLTGKLSAGSGIMNYFEDKHEEDYDIAEVPFDAPTNFDYLYEVTGDSMEPMFQDGEYVYAVKICDNSDITTRGVYVVRVNGESYIKKVRFDQDTMYLVSINEKYKEIPVTDSDSVQIVAKVLL